MTLSRRSLIGGWRCTRRCSSAHRRQPAASPPNRLGLIGGDPAGFPNGRRQEDDVTTIELGAVAGLTYPLVSPAYVPDGAAAAIEDGTCYKLGRVPLSEFPYMGTPSSGTRWDMSDDHAHAHAWRDPHAAPGSVSVLDIGGSVDVGRGEAWIAVLLEVLAGDYSLLTDDGVEHAPVEVTNSQVTSLDLSVAMLAGRQ